MATLYSWDGGGACRYPDSPAEPWTPAEIIESIKGLKWWKEGPDGIGCRFYALMDPLRKNIHKDMPAVFRAVAAEAGLRVELSDGWQHDAYTALRMFGPRVADLDFFGGLCDGPDLSPNMKGM